MPASRNCKSTARWQTTHLQNVEKQEKTKPQNIGINLLKSKETSEAEI